MPGNNHILYTMLSYFKKEWKAMQLWVRKKSTIRFRRQFTLGTRWIKTNYDCWFKSLIWTTPLYSVISESLERCEDWLFRSPHKHSDSNKTKCVRIFEYVSNEQYNKEVLKKIISFSHISLTLSFSWSTSPKSGRTP